ncbi:uncharacterized protein LOC122869490 isoform X1 [Xyrichtys novacula]|uniref:Uncharacterized protein LOC122869490 isoform X1 n=1 Tax=Xyrichtys novacula TaxID=13765 RepID=A0AAV1GPE7_XYRNO|nr:uncharacterized protein LOC122869490 isoform X1 [Xyrichtys novacula]
MDKNDPSPKPQGPVSQDDGDLRMKVDSTPGTDHKEKESVKCDERPQTPPATPVITRYYGGTDDDEVFIQLPRPSPPSSMPPLLSVEGSRDGKINHSNLTFANGPADATEAKANPGGLDWHHGEKQLMAAPNKLDELMMSTAETSEESMNTAALPKEKGSKDRDSTSMENTGSLMGPCYDPSRGSHQDDTTRKNELTEEPEDIDIEILSERQATWNEVEADGDDKYPKQVPVSTEERSKTEEHFHRDKDKVKSDGFSASTGTKSKLSTDKVDCSGTKTNAPTRSSLTDRDDLKPSVSPELCKYNQNSSDEATTQPQLSEITRKAPNDEQHVDTRSLNYKLAKYDWVRRESGISETLSPRPSVGEETISRTEQGQGSRGLNSNVQQGEQLLQRLQVVQQRQDVHAPEKPPTFQLTGPDMESEKEAVFGVEADEMQDGQDHLMGLKRSRLHTVEDDGANANLVEEKGSECDHAETKAWLSLPTMSVKPDHYPIVRTEAGYSDDDEKSEVWVPTEWSSNDEVSSTHPMSNRPRLSVAETSLEKQIHEVAQKKQNLQRAGGVFNLADNLDVIEIPFKTNFSLEPSPAKVGPGTRSSWQFSEQKMQKEISQEIQRELVLVNQGKIPGAYSKGEVRQLKETKLLFEAFQQENMEGPTRHRKSPTSLSKGHVYPSVLERTRSLEMFSLKSLPVSRTHSLRVHDPATAQMTKGPEDFRAKSPNGGPRDKTRVSPYQKQDKHARQYRSMDLMSAGVSDGETRRNVGEGNASGESPILKHNPFFKLRPALVLQPEVEKDIREAKEREEELRRQRCTLYGESRWKSKDKEKSRFTPTLTTDATGQSRGKLDRFWPPPSKKDQKSESTQQEAKVRRTAGQKASLWQRWESGQINGQPSQEKN